MSHAALLIAIVFVTACGAQGGGKHAPRSSSRVTKAVCEATAAPLALGADAFAEDALARVEGRLPRWARGELAARRTRQAGRVDHVDVHVTVDGVRLCAAPARAHKIGARIMVEGIPDLSTAQEPHVSLSEWPDLGATGEPCFVQDGSKLLPAVRYVWTPAFGATEIVVADAHRTYSRTKRAFHATGQARVLARNPLVKDFTDVRLPQLDGEGTLRGARFRTVLPDEDERLTSQSLTFDAPESAELSIFAHAEMTLQWFERLDGHYDQGCAIELEIHATNGADHNVARYLPADEAPAGRPRIRLGDGDGFILRNLALDADVIGHELGHHAIFRRLHSTEGDSGVLHEAIADYLVAARTGDPCIAASICPKGGALCSQQGKCLRNVRNTLSLADIKTQHLPPHERSQVISGLLWDLAGATQGGHAAVARLAFHAIEYLSPNAGYETWLAALGHADRALTDGARLCAIAAGAARRGLADKAEIIWADESPGAKHCN